MERDGSLLSLAQAHAYKPAVHSHCTQYTRSGPGPGHVLRLKAAASERGADGIRGRVASHQPPSQAQARARTHVAQRNAGTMARARRRARGSLCMCGVPVARTLLELELELELSIRIHPSVCPSSCVHAYACAVARGPLSLYLVFARKRRVACAQGPRRRHDPGNMRRRANGTGRDGGGVVRGGGNWQLLDGSPAASTLAGACASATPVACGLWEGDRTPVRGVAAPPFCFPSVRPGRGGSVWLWCSGRQQTYVYVWQQVKVYFEPKKKKLRYTVLEAVQLIKN